MIIPDTGQLQHSWCQDLVDDGKLLNEKSSRSLNNAGVVFCLFLDCVKWAVILFQDPGLDSARLDGRVMEVGPGRRRSICRRTTSPSCPLGLVLYKLIHCSGCDLLLAFTLWCCCGGVMIIKPADGHQSAVPGSSDSQSPDGDELTLRPDYYDHNKMCLYEGRVYPRGTFQPERCTWCECTQEGITRCWAQTCPLSMDPQCIRYKTLPGDCCPTCVEVGCMYNGTGFKRGASILTGDSCRKCYCPWEGESRGEPVCLDIHCPAVHCVDSHTPPGKCCPVCPNGESRWLSSIRSFKITWKG